MDLFNVREICAVRCGIISHTLSMKSDKTIGYINLKEGCSGKLAFVFLLDDFNLYYETIP